MFAECIVIHMNRLAVGEFDGVQTLKSGQKTEEIIGTFSTHDT